MDGRITHLQSTMVTMDIPWDLTCTVECDIQDIYGITMTNLDINNNKQKHYIIYLNVCLKTAKKTFFKT